MVLHKTCATSSFSASDIKVNLEPRNVNANTNRAARRSLGGKNSEHFSLSSSQMVYRLWHIDDSLTSLAYNSIIEIYKYEPVCHMAKIGNGQCISVTCKQVLNKCCRKTIPALHVGVSCYRKGTRCEFVGNKFPSS